MVNPRFVIKAVLSGQRLNINVPLTVAGTVNYIGVEAKCTSEWDDCTVVCYLYQAGTGYTAQLGLIYDAERKLYYFPNAERLTLTAGEWAVWFVGVMAESGQETYRVTSDTRYFNVYPNPFASSIPPGDISLDEEAIARATDAQNKANLLLDKYNAGELTGPKGDPGDPAHIGFVQASVDNTTSNPSCEVTVTQSPANTYNMQFAFSGIKGAKGDTGATGPKGDTGATGAPGRDGTDGRDGVDGETIDDYVLVQAEQPTSETNKMWLKPTASGDPIMIPSAEEFSSLEADIRIHKDGVPAEFSNVYIGSSNGSEGASDKVVTTNRYYNLQQDGLLYVEALEPYAFACYAWDRYTMKGYIRPDNTIGTSGSIAFLHKLDLSNYPKNTFRFALARFVNGERVTITPSEAPNLKFTFRVNNSLSGRRVSVMGDSISSFTGFLDPDYEDSANGFYPNASARVYHVQNMFWQALIDRNGMVRDTIDAFPGANVGDRWQTSEQVPHPRIPFYDDSRVNRLGTPDIIIIEGGINDFGGNPLGDYPPLGDYTKTYEFRTAYSLLLNKLKNKYKAATIICLSLVSPRNYNNTTFPEKQTEVKQALATDTTPHTFAEFNESIKTIAEQYQCAYCDITDLLNYYTNPTSSLGPHWYYNLHIEVAYRIEQLLKQIYA